MNRPVLESLSFLVLSVLLLSGCPSKAKPCENSDVCLEGYACNLGTGECVAEALLAPDSGEEVKKEVDAAPVTVCPKETHTCTVAPEGWLGPVVGMGETVDSAPTACDEGYEEALVAKDELEGVGACSCSCPGNAVGVTCGRAEYRMPKRLDKAPPVRALITRCPITGIAKSVHALTNYACTKIPNTYEGDVYFRLPSVVNAGSCEAAVASNDLSTIFHKQESFCSLVKEEAGACEVEGQTCLPNKKGSDSPSNICIYQAGEHECPAEFPEHSLKYLSAQDNRSCTTCSCPGTGAASCGGKIIVRKTHDSRIRCTDGVELEPLCRGLEGTSNDNDNDNSRYNRYAMFTPSNSTFSCESGKKGGALEGEAVAEGAMTICCK